MGEVGKYIVIEGSDGTGKSTQVELLAEHLQEIGIETVTFHEPDGVEIASEIRTIIKNGDLARTAFTNLLLFSAARRENWLQQGLPALERGAWVLSARDYTSTLIYQGIGEGLSLKQISYTLDATDERYINPNHRVILTIDDEKERQRRINQRGELENPDTFESRDNEFQQKIADGYKEIARRKEIPTISASQSKEEIQQKIQEIVLE